VIVNTNSLRLIGTVATDAVYSHICAGEQFYHFTIAVSRQSGTFDNIPVLLGTCCMGYFMPHSNQMISVEAIIFTTFKNTDGADHLMIYALAERIALVENNYGVRNVNWVMLSGAICKRPVIRTTPFGRVITDMMLAVNRMPGVSYYIPCIAWGRNAHVAAILRLGDHVTVEGRVQSRQYQKKLPDGNVLDKVTYEVSITHIDKSPL